MAGEELSSRRESTLRGLERFHDSNGLRFDRLAIDADLIRAYLASAKLAQSSLGTYRWVLTLGSDCRIGLSFLGSKGAMPYSALERSELVSIASSQKKLWRRSSALVMIAVSIGAGARSGELRYLRAEDLDKKRSSMKIAGRMVPIKAPWSDILFSIEREKGEYLFHPGALRRSSKNFINDFASALTKDPGSPRFQMARARSSFVCDRWNEGVSLTELLAMTGIREVESLIRYVHLLDGAPETKAGLRRLLRSGDA